MQILTRQRADAVALDCATRKCWERGGENVENVNKNYAANKVLDGIAWGTLIILLGAGWLTSAYYAMDVGAYVAVGVGLILIALNLVRPSLGVKISKFSLFIGLLALALGGAGILGYSLPLIPTVIVLIGLFIVAEGLQKATAQKQQHA